METNPETGSKRIGLFATRADLLALISEFEQLGSVKYVSLDDNGKKQKRSLRSLLLYRNLGKNKNGNANHASRFLILPREAEVHVREISLNNGKKKYVVDQSTNPDSVILSVPGIYKKLFQEPVFIPGSVATIYSEGMSFKFMQTFEALLRKKFTKVNAFWLGPEANSLFENGIRFAPNAIQSPPEYDLRRS